MSKIPQQASMLCHHGITAQEASAVTSCTFVRLSFSTPGSAQCPKPLQWYSKHPEHNALGFCRLKQPITRWTAATYRSRDAFKVLDVQQHIVGLDEANRAHQEQYKAEFVETAQGHSFEFSQVCIFTRSDCTGHAGLVQATCVLSRVAAGSLLKKAS